MRPKTQSQAEHLLQEAETIARSMKQSYLGTEHVFLAGILAGFVDAPFSKVGITTQAAELILRDSISSGEETSFPTVLPRTPRMKRALDRAMELALKEQNQELLPSHILSSILEEKNGIVAIALADLGTSSQALHDALANPDVVSSRVLQEQKIAKSTPLLNKLGRDLTALAKDGKLEPVIGRSDELRRVMQILTRKNKNVPLLIGEPGVGKTAVVFALAQRLSAGNVPKPLIGKRLIELPLSSIVADTAHRGELEQRVQKIFEETSGDPDVILFIDEIHGLAGAGTAQGGLDIGNMFKPGLADGSLRVIGATTTEEYQKYLAKDQALERRLQPVLVNEPSIEETEEILKGLKTRYEKYHGVIFDEEAIQQAVKLSVRYLPDRRLPDKAIDLLDEAASRVKTKTNIGPSPVVDKEEIACVVSLWTGIPAQKLSESEKEKFLQLEEKLKEKVIGQDHAIEKISPVIRISRAGIGNPRKPVGVFLFLGPTGVGKTELAKALAEIIFGSQDNMIRIDMSEYKEKHSVARLIGAPPGYVGHDEEGQLTKAVHRRPYSLILFDEIEKAHPEVLDLFLQIFDDGRLTDSKGRTVHFNNTLIVMTSNIGSARILDKNLHAQIMEEVKSTLRPEFINRIDELIVFNPLTEENLEKIVQLQIRELQERLKEQKIRLTVAPDAIQFLIRKGYEPAFGARPLRRAVQQYLSKPLAEGLLEGKFTGWGEIKAEVEEDRLIVKPATVEPGGPE